MTQASVAVPLAIALLAALQFAASSSHSTEITPTNLDRAQTIAANAPHACDADDLNNPIIQDAIKAAMDRREVLNSNIERDTKMLEDRKSALTGGTVFASIALGLGTADMVLAGAMTGGTAAVYLSPTLMGGTTLAAGSLFTALAAGAGGSIAGSSILNEYLQSGSTPEDALETRKSDAAFLIEVGGLAVIEPKFAQAHAEINRQFNEKMKQLDANRSLMHMGWDEVREMQLLVALTQAHLKLETLERNVMNWFTRHVQEICSGDPAPKDK